MEEDIKILEDFIKYYEAEAISRKFRGTLSISVDEQDIQALENLLTRYKQLEEEKKKLKTIKGFEEENIEVSKFGEWVGKDYIDYKFEYENYQRILADSIPKSKIKEKIKELKYQTLYINGITDKNETEIASLGSLFGKIQVLQDLLEEE